MHLRAQNFVHTLYKTNDGLVSNITYGIVQDSKGYIWFATSKGVCKFNGTKFTNYTDADGLTDNSTLKLFCDSQDRIWISTLNGKPCYIKNNIVYSAKNEKSLAQISNTLSLGFISEDKNNNIYINCVSSDIFWQISSTGAVKKFEHPNKLANRKPSIYLTAQYKNEVVTVFSQDGIMPLHNLEQQKPYMHGTEMAKNYSINLISKTIDNEKVFYVVSNGINSYNIQHKTFSNEIIFDDEIRNLHIKTINVLHNKIWISLNEGGVACYEKRHNAWKYKYTLFKDISVNNIFEDANGNFWLTTNFSGVIFLPNFFEKVTMLSENIESLVQPANCISAYENELWVGSTNARILKYNNDSLVNVVDVNQKSNFNGKFVFKILADGEHVYSSYLAGFFKLKKSNNHSTEVFQYPAERGGVSLPIKNFSLQSNGSVFIASSAKDFIVPTNSNTAYKIEQSVGHRSFYCYTDPLNNSFVSNSNGLALYNAKDSSYTYLDTTNEILSNRINAMCYLNTNKYILGNSKGLFLLNNNKVTKLSLDNALLQNVECLKLISKFQTIWVLQHNAIFEIQISSNNKVLIKNILSTANGILPFSPNDIDETETKLYIATNQGVLIFDKAQGIINSVFKVAIASVVSGNQEYVFDNNPTIKSSNGAINIYLDLLSYGSKSQHEFEYKLSKDGTWITLNASNLQLDNLKHGQHTLYVRGRIREGEWSEIVTYPFFYFIPFYKQLWAQFIALLIICGAAFSFYEYNQQKKFAREQEKYEMKNKISTMENQALQSLMHPHFVFNSLNSIQSYINDNDKENANRYLSKFAKLIRLNLNSGINGFITIEDEMERLQLYLSLEQLRFERQFSFNIEVNKVLEAEMLYLPSMILQPFVENSIWHGILPSKQTGVITIDFNVFKNNNLCITITDNGIGVEKSKANSIHKKHESKGLALIFARLQLLSEKYKKPFTIKESIPHLELPNPGHQVVLQIPFLYEDDIN